MIREDHIGMREGKMGFQSKRCGRSIVRTVDNNHRCPRRWLRDRRERWLHVAKIKELLEGGTLLFEEIWKVLRTSFHKNFVVYKLARKFKLYH